MMDHFTSYRQIAMVFLLLRRFELPVNYFDFRAQQLLDIDNLSVKRAVQRVLDAQSLVTVKVGRI